MTDIIDAEAHTRPIAARRYSPTIYDINATAVFHPGESPIFLGVAPIFLGGRPAETWITTGDIHGPDPAHAAEWARLDDLLQDPPTGPVPPLPPQPPTPAKAAAVLCGCCLLEETPYGKHGRRRLRWRPWQYAAVGALVTAAAGYAGLVLAGWLVMA